MEPRDYVNQKGWSFKQVGSQLRVRVCPLCGDKKGHFYMHAEKGLWDCKKCLESGNLFQLRIEA